jgi:hypothetical protein
MGVDNMSKEKTCQSQSRQMLRKNFFFEFLLAKESLGNLGMATRVHNFKGTMTLPP